jgi:ATP-dependent DNA helicase PIF1
MIDARTFDVVDEVGKILRQNSTPFGGLQVCISTLLSQCAQTLMFTVAKLVICGDFFQLPPVPDQICRDTGVPVSFAFEARCWDLAVPTKISLTKVFRQKEEGQLQAQARPPAYPSDLRVQSSSKFSTRCDWVMFRNNH